MLLCGKCPPRVAAAVLARCTVFAGHDSGPMHLSACVGVRCAAVFSARNLPVQWHPHGRGHLVFRADVSCAGCGLEVCVAEGRRCLAMIPADEVVRAVVGLARESEEGAE